MQYVAFTCVLDVSTCTWVIFRHANTKNIQRKYNKNLSAPWPRSDKLVLFHQVYTFLFNLTVKKLQNVLCLSYVFRRKVSEILIVLYVSNPAEAVGFLRRKNPQHAFLRRGWKPSVPCRIFAACKRFLNLCGSGDLGKITGHISRPQFHLSLLGSLASLRTYRHLAAKMGTSKGGGKQWKTTPKNLSRMQCARAIPVTTLGSGFCQPGL